MNGKPRTRWLILALIAVCLAASAVLLSGPLHRANADVECASFTTLSLGAQASRTTTGGTPCFRVSVPSGTPVLNIKLESTRGSFDLYMARGGNVSPLRDALHKFNLSPIESDDPSSTFVLQYPPGGTYTIGVTPRSTGNNNFRLKVSTPEVASTQPSGSQCSGDTCSHSIPLVVAADAEIGSEFGARAVFPIDITCPGRIEATAFWSGTAERLALILNGPGQVGYFDRADGASPLTVQATATQAQLQSGSRWWVSLVNFRGGAATGRVTIDYPDPDSCAAVDSIRNLRVNRVTDDELRVAVDYTYSGGHGENVYMGVYALRNGQKERWFGYRPTQIFPGAGTATVDLVLLTDRNPPVGLTTDQIQFEMYVGGGSSFHQQTFDYTRTWTQAADSINSFRVVGESDGEATFAVNYTYGGSHGSSVYMAAYGYQNGRRLTWFGFRPAQVTTGEGAALVTLVLLDESGAPASFETDQVQFEMYVGGGSEFITRRFDYTKAWASGAQRSLHDILIERMALANVPNLYPRQAIRFADALPELLGAFDYRADVGDRINGTVNAIWGDWVNRAAQRGFNVSTTDPGSQGFSPFRQLVIRIVQGRQGRLSDAEDGALRSLLTRSEDADVWSSGMDGVIGALNREYFP